MMGLQGWEGVWGRTTTSHLHLVGVLSRRAVKTLGGACQIGRLLSRRTVQARSTGRVVAGTLLAGSAQGVLSRATLFALNVRYFGLSSAAVVGR